MNMSETWQRRVLFAAAAWTLLGGTAALLDAPGQPAWIAVIAWGAAYLAAALVPASRRVVVIAGGAGKAAYLAWCAALFAQGAMPGAVFAASSVDLVFVVLFAAMAFRGDGVPALRYSAGSDGGTRWLERAKG
jgi:hypothetical protein